MAFEDYNTDAEVMTHSMLKSMRRCPRIVLYKHHDLLAPKSISKPLKRGTWFHALMEAHYKGEDWKAVHKSFTNEFSKLFDEEQDKLGDLPKEIYKLMISYLWHYQDDQDWTVHETEMKIETPLPNGQLYRGKVDMLVEDEYGLWVVDHKTNQTLPSLTQRLLDQQSVLYLWAARRCDIPVTGFIWNYIRTNAPKDIRVTRSGTIAKNQGSTDYPTAYRSLKEQGYDPKTYKSFLVPLQKQRYVSGEVQYSPFFQRHILEKNEAMINRSLKEAMRTAERFRDYDFEDRDGVERVNDRSCDWCSYRNLCTTELIGGNADNVRRQEFMKHDPLAYYDDPIKAE